MDPAIASSLAGLLVIQGVTLFAAHAPKIGDVRRARSHSDVGADLRVAELESVAVMVLAGTAVSAMAKTPVPVWLALATSATMVGIYEWVLHQPADLPAFMATDPPAPTLVAVEVNR